MDGPNPWEIKGQNMDKLNKWTLLSFVLFFFSSGLKHVIDYLVEFSCVGYIEHD